MDRHWRLQQSFVPTAFVECADNQYDQWDPAALWTLQQRVLACSDSAQFQTSGLKLNPNWCLPTQPILWFHDSTSGSRVAHQEGNHDVRQTLLRTQHSDCTHFGAHKELHPSPSSWSALSRLPESIPQLLAVQKRSSVGAPKDSAVRNCKNHPLYADISLRGSLHTTQWSSCILISLGKQK